MSKIGKKPINIPSGVEVTIDNNIVTVKGPKGELSEKILDCVSVKKEENNVILSINNIDDGKFRGLSRTLIANMIEGVINGYEKKLLVMGVGYGAQLQGNKLVLSLGFSHKVNYELPNNVKVKVELDPKGNSIITLNSIDKQLLGEIASKIRGFKKPEPYKGKGVRYFDEFVKLKAGKSAGK
ncbi:MAG TPA: 50S ribosomal protein L6 [Candidatus Absconditabacterales bacterium]|nr:50S ribosomal protein L6 [Candidatus Absconditabacterales bacterium]HOQ79034.1 50S ribosomal protein L6 [Candidatus Absconditabacterales bacterium]HPK27636.1 50S ribosomal protein L6 [Candidatus Absconditabacterales bacterium]